MSKKVTDNRCYDASVELLKLGKIIIHPKESDKEPAQVTTDGNTVSTRGRMIMNPDGFAVFTPFKTCNSPRYNIITDTDHGSARRFTAGSVVVSFTFPPQMAPQDMRDALVEEAGNIGGKIEIS